MIQSSSVAMQKGASYLNRLVLAGATLTTAQRQAITALAKAIDAIGVSKFSAIYPFLGGSAACHAIDLLGAYPITWAGTVTHDANGITGDGSTGYGDTGLPCNTFTYDNLCLGVYLRNSFAGNNSLLVGQYTGSYTGLFGNSSGQTFVSGASSATATSATVPTGHYCGTGDSSLLTAYRAGASISTKASPTAATFNSTNYNLLRIASPAGTYSLANLAFAHIGTRLTSTEVATLATAIQAYQTALGRNV